ncbi:MAG: hypothetical protein ACLUD0_09870 [Eubacterium ramulus]
MGSALQTIFEKPLRSFEPMIQNYYKANTAVFAALAGRYSVSDGRCEIYSGYAVTQGFEMCRPQICPVKDQVCELEQVYNPMLAMRGVEKTVVSNRV